MDWRTKRKNRVRPPGRTLPKATDNSDMYSRAFPVGNALFFFAGGVMSLFCLPCGKLSLAFLAVPAGKDGWVECPCQTVNDFIGIRGSVGGLFLFVQTHAPLIVPPWQSRARKSKLQFHIRRKGAEVFQPALAAGGSLTAYKCLSLCGLFSFFKGFSENLLGVRTAGIEVPCKLVEVSAHLAALSKQGGNSGQGFFSAASNDDRFLDLDVVDGAADESGEGEIQEFASEFQ